MTDGIGRETRGRVTIVGGGLDFSAHPSAEACRAVRAAAVVFHAGCHPAVARWLADLAPGAAVHDIDEGCYEVGQFRPEMYARMAARVVAAALAEGETVLIEPGSARVTDLVTPLVLAAARAAGVETRVVPGISSLEHVFIAFGIDPATGFQTVLAQELVARRLRLNPGFDSVVIQPGYYDTLWCVGWPHSRPDRFDALAETLALSFAPDQPMALVRFPMHPGDEVHRFWFVLSDLARLAPLMTPLHSLFVPAAEPAGREAGFAARMHRWDESLRFLELDGAGAPRQREPVATNTDLAEVEAGLPGELRARARDLDARWQASREDRALARIRPGGRAGEPIPAG